MVDNLKDFLMDKSYYVDIYDNKLHLFNYVELMKLRDSEIIIKFSDFDFKVIGTNLTILEMDKQEILIEGIINTMEFIK